MTKVSTIGLDLAKHVFQVHGVGEHGDRSATSAAQRGDQVFCAARADDRRLALLGSGIAGARARGWTDAGSPLATSASRITASEQAARRRRPAWRRGALPVRCCRRASPAGSVGLLK